MSSVENIGSARVKQHAQKYEGKLQNEYDPANKLTSMHPYNLQKYQQGVRHRLLSTGQHICT